LGYIVAADIMGLSSFKF